MISGKRKKTIHIPMQNPTHKISESGQITFPLLQKKLYLLLKFDMGYELCAVSESIEHHNWHVVDYKSLT